MVALACHPWSQSPISSAGSENNNQTPFRINFNHYDGCRSLGMQAPAYLFLVALPEPHPLWPRVSMPTGLIHTSSSLAYDYRAAF